MLTSHPCYTHYAWKIIVIFLSSVLLEYLWGIVT